MDGVVSCESVQGFPVQGMVDRVGWSGLLGSCRVGSMGAHDRAGEESLRGHARFGLSRLGGLTPSALVRPSREHPASYSSHQAGSAPPWFVDHRLSLNPITPWVSCVPFRVPHASAGEGVINERTPPRGGRFACARSPAERSTSRRTPPTAARLLAHSV
jgi:hypothetical protein